MSAHGVVLVVEDDPALKDTWVAVFQQCGYQVVSAADADSAIEQARTSPDAWNDRRDDNLTGLRGRS